MKNDVKPRFINLLVKGENEIDVRTLTKEEKEEVSIQLNRQAMGNIGYIEKKESRVK